MLEFTYNNGRGHVQLNLEMILPCSAADMKRIMSFVDLSTDPYEHAKAVYDYIAGRVAELKEERGKHDENSAAGKEKISKINAEMKKYLSNVAALAKSYGLPELKDDAAQITMHAATIYAIENKSPEQPHEVEMSIKTYEGWTFEKAGYTFDVYKKSKAYYRILVHGTGLACATARNKTAAPAEITPRLLETLTKNADKIENAKETFNKLMIDAGFMEPERTETISNNNATETKEETEVSTMSDFTFTANTMTCKGKTFSAEYNIIADGSVLVFAIINVKEDGRKEKQRIHFKPDHPDYPAALEAAKAFKESAGGSLKYISTGYVKKVTPAGNVIEKAPAAEAVQEETAKAFENIPVIDTETGETVTENAAEIIAETPAAETVQEEKPAENTKAARGPVPEKTFIGEVIQGNGWKIIFDGETARTRIIFEELPTEAAKEALKEAGFYYSANMDSWNKKLTFKAYRAAKAISGKLSELYAA